MADTLFARRPPVATIAMRMMAMTPLVRFLKPASVLNFGLVAKSVWAYLDLTRQADVNQPVADQLRLAGIEAAMRGAAVTCLRLYINAVGPLELQLTQDARAALDQMTTYDVRFAPTFDVENTVLRIVRGAKII